MPLSPIIIALDVDNQADALKWVDRLDKQVDIFKIGLQLFTKEGPGIVDAVLAKGKKVFLDLKFHDIPNTVFHAIQSVAKPGIELLTIHASGGKEMMEAAARAIQEQKKQHPALSTKILAVTVLTSLDNANLKQVGVTHSVADQVVNLARLTQTCGIHGIVCSPHEVRPLRTACGPNLLLVTPGIRPTTSAVQDQKRVMTPAQAMQEGSNFLVMGRSILDVPDPVKALSDILAVLSK